MNCNLCQRWVRGRAAWRPAREAFDPRAFDVASIGSDRVARDFVVGHHYARSYPAARYRFGIYERGELAGVAVFSVPMHAAVLRPWGMGDAVELGRLVLLDRVLANAESWFVARCFELLRREGLAGVVSFSDPEPRATASGEVVFAGHVGTTYASLNAVYEGRARSQTLRLLPDATVLSARAVAKVRQRERGWRYVVDQLVQAGAPAPESFEGGALRAWVDEAIARVTRPLRHHGNYRYAWGLTPGARRMLGASLPYPKVWVRDCMAGPRRAACAASPEACRAR